MKVISEEHEGSYTLHFGMELSQYRDKINKKVKGFHGVEDDIMEAIDDLAEGNVYSFLITPGKVFDGKEVAERLANAILFDILHLDGVEIIHESQRPTFWDKIINLCTR